MKTVEATHNPIYMVRFSVLLTSWASGSKPNKMKKVNKQCLLDTPRTVRVSEKTWQFIVRTRRP